MAKKKRRRNRNRSRQRQRQRNLNSQQAHATESSPASASRRSDQERAAPEAPNNATTDTRAAGTGVTFSATCGTDDTTTGTTADAGHQVPEVPASTRDQDSPVVSSQPLHHGSEGKVETAVHNRTAATAGASAEATSTVPPEMVPAEEAPGDAAEGKTPAAPDDVRQPSASESAAPSSPSGPATAAEKHEPSASEVAVASPSETRSAARAAAAVAASRNAQPNDSADDIVNEFSSQAGARKTPSGVSDLQPEPGSAAKPAAEQIEQPPWPGRFAAFKGMAVGAVLTIPILALTLAVLIPLGFSNENVSVDRALRIAAVFAGVPAVLTWLGIGRIASRQALVPGSGLRRALIYASLSGAIAGIGLALLVAVPLGTLPQTPAHYAWLGLAGSLAGTICGGVAGLWVAWPIGHTPRRSGAGATATPAKL